MMDDGGPYTHRRFVAQLRSRWGFLIVCMVLMIVMLLVFEGGFGRAG